MQVNNPIEPNSSDLKSLVVGRLCLNRGTRVVSVDDREIMLTAGEYDVLVPLKEAEDLYNNLGTKDKELVIIGAADHNDIMFVGFEQYFGAIVRFIEGTA